LPDDTLSTLERLGIERPRKWSPTRWTLRFREVRLEEGDTIWVLGRASVVVDPSGERDDFRGPPVTRVFHGSPLTVVADDYPSRQA
jgi:hypothetical protein